MSNDRKLGHAATLAVSADIKKNPRRILADGDETQIAAKGDVDGEWESYGSLGTRKGGDIFNPADKEGDLDLEGYEKARNEEGNEARGTDHKDPNDAKGWRRQLWIKKQRPMS